MTPGDNFCGNQLGRQQLALAIAALGATNFRAPGLRHTGPEIELSFFETTPSGRDSGGILQTYNSKAHRLCTPPSLAGTVRILAGTVYFG